MTVAGHLLPTTYVVRMCPANPVTKVSGAEIQAIYCQSDSRGADGETCQRVSPCFAMAKPVGETVEPLEKPLPDEQINI